MADPRLLARARVRAGGMTIWAAYKADDLPTLVRNFVEQDLPFLLQAAGTYTVADLLDAENADSTKEAGR